MSIFRFPLRAGAMTEIANVVLSISALILLYEAWAPLLAPGLTDAFNVWLSWLDDTYRIVTLNYQDMGGARRLVYSVTLNKTVWMGGHMVYVDPRAVANATLPFAAVFLPAMVSIPMALGLRAAGPKQRALRVVLTLPPLFLLLILDAPLVLWSEVWAMHVAALEPDRFSPLLIWCSFLQGGGRIALGVFISLFANYESNRFS